MGKIDKKQSYCLRGIATISVSICSFNAGLVPGSDTNLLINLEEAELTSLNSSESRSPACR